MIISLLIIQQLITTIHVKCTSNQTIPVYALKVIHVHHDLRQMFITLVWNDQ